jgi:hypothetical protein
MWYVIAYLILMFIHIGIFYAWYLEDGAWLTVDDYACIILEAIFFPIVWAGVLVYLIFSIPFIVVDWIKDH